MTPPAPSPAGSGAARSGAEPAGARAGSGYGVRRATALRRRSLPRHRSGARAGSGSADAAPLPGAGRRRSPEARSRARARSTGVGRRRWPRHRSVPPAPADAPQFTLPQFELPQFTAAVRASAGPTFEFNLPQFGPPPADPAQSTSSKHAVALQESPPGGPDGLAAVDAPAGLGALQTDAAAAPRSAASCRPAPAARSGAAVPAVIAAPTRWLRSTPSTSPPAFNTANHAVSGQLPAPCGRPAPAQPGQSASRNHHGARATPTGPEYDLPAASSGTQCSPRTSAATMPCWRWRSGR